MSPLLAPLLLLLYGPKAIVLFGLFVKFKRVQVFEEEKLPSISVLVPARNEAENIGQCLETLKALDYPVEKLEILVGDDQSTDQTTQIVAQLTSEISHVRLIRVEPEYEGLVARSNVLAQLARKAQGDYLVFLDADMQVDPVWLKNMVFPTLMGHEVVSGYTQVVGQGLSAGMQTFDWYNVLAWLKAAADLSQPGTALGNNMLVSKNAYMTIGGYERIGPTFTEDNDLTLALRQNGSQLFQVAVAQNAKTKPVERFSELLSQRNRWMIGAFRQPLVKLLPVLWSRLFVLVALLFSVWSYELAIAFIAHNVFLDLLIAVMMRLKSGVRTNIFYALIAPVINSLLDTFTLLSYPWNKQVVWKGRKL